MRYLTGDAATAAAGLALDEALMTSYRRGMPERAPALRLYTYRGCALAGRYQNLEAEIDLEACARTGTEVGRRPTGGGAIVMGAGQLGVAVTSRAPAAERPKETLERLSSGIVRGLEELGIEATFRGKNDLEAGGRKIAGLGLYIDSGGAMLFHASVLASLDVPFMLEVLRVPAAKLADKAAAAVSERVTTVCEQTGEPWSGATLRDVVAAGFEKAFGSPLVPGEATSQELNEASRLEDEKYATAGWIRERSAPTESMGTATFRTPAGLVRVFVAVDGGVMRSVLFTGDFNQLPPELLRLEEALRWKRIESAASIARRVCTELPPQAVGTAVADAAGRASRRTVSAPTRQGSCYFPQA